MRTPTQRSLAHLKKRGYECKVVEKWMCPCITNTEHGRRVDVWGCDILAVGSDILLVQTTSSSNHAARVKRLQEIPELRAWVRLGGGVEVHSWGSRKRDGRDWWVGRIEVGELDAFGQLVFTRQPDVWSARPRRKQVRSRKRLQAMYG